jgi:hypothetical protein
MGSGLSSVKLFSPVLLFGSFLISVSNSYAAGDGSRRQRAGERNIGELLAAGGLKNARSSCSQS